MSLSTVRDFEKGRREPIANNMAAIHRALTDAGMQFLKDEKGNAAGIRMKQDAGGIAAD